jgi:hypothetical protein
MGTNISSPNTGTTDEQHGQNGIPDDQQQLPEERTEAEEAAADTCDREAEESEVSEEEGKKVADRREEVRDALDGELSIEEQHIFGSLTRGTLVGPLDEDSDTDVMFVLDKDEHGNWAEDGERGPRNCLRRVKRIIQNDPRFEDADISIDRNVVAIQCDDFTVEVAPAFRDGDDYVIPNTYREGSGWVRTNPRRYKQRFEAVNDNRNGNLAKLARLAKKYNERTGKKISSYHMEVMVYDFMRTRSYQDEPMDKLVDDFFEQLPERMSSGTYDPATDQRVDDGLRNEDRDKAISNAKKAREKLRRARERKENNEADSEEHYEEVINGDIE